MHFFSINTKLLFIFWERQETLGRKYIFLLQMIWSYIENLDQYLEAGKAGGGIYVTATTQIKITLSYMFEANELIPETKISAQTNTFF